MIKEVEMVKSGTDYIIKSGDRVIGYVAVTQKHFVVNSVFMDISRHYTKLQNALKFLVRETELFIKEVIDEKQVEIKEIHDTPSHSRVVSVS